VFQSESFVDKVLAPLQYLGLVPFELIAFRPARADTGGEFTCVLRKGVPAVQLRREQFFTKDFAPRAPAAPAAAAVAEPAPAAPVAPPRLRDVLFPRGTRRRELLWRLKRRLGG
jgi:hypothetical protein